MEPNPKSNGGAATSMDAASMHSGLLASKGDGSAKQAVAVDSLNNRAEATGPDATPGQVDVSQLSREEIARIVMSGFQGSIPTHRTSRGYFLGVGLALLQFCASEIFVALILILFSVPLFVLLKDEPLVLILGVPLAVFAFVLLAAFFWAIKLRHLMYWTARPADYKEPPTCRVTPESEPLLWELVRRIADTVGARHPSHIEIICDANAGALRVRNARGELTNQRALAIGLPLTAEMTVQQLAGIIAHEFGHFSQTMGSQIRMWLALLIECAWWPSSRDELDDRLLATISAAQGKIGRNPTFSTKPYLFSWWLGGIRKVCARLRLPKLVHAYANREGEYDADQYHYRLVGSDVFEQTSKCLAMHMCAFVSTSDDVTRYFREKRLPDDLLPLIDRSLTSYSQLTRIDIENVLLDEDAQPDDTYPSGRDRIAAAKQFNALGVYRCDLPASVLFSNLGEWSRRVTHDLYLTRFDDSLTASDLLPAEVLLAEKKLEANRHDQTHAFCLGTCLHSRSVPLPHGEDADCLVPSGRPMSDLIKVLSTVRNAMSDRAASYHANVQKWCDAVEAVWKGNAAESLLKEGVKPLPKQLAEFDGNPALSQEHQESGRAEMEDLKSELLEFETMAGRRWRIAAELLANPDFIGQNQIAGAELVRARAVMRLIAALDGTLNERRELYDHIRTTQLLLDSNRDTYSEWMAIYERIEETKSRYESILRQFDGCEYPFPHNRPNFTVVEYLTPFEDMATISKKWLDGARETIRASWDLSNRAIDTMCALALEIEAALGLPPLPQVVTRNEESDDVSQTASNAP